MSNKTLGQMICSLRKEKNMTQNDLAEKMIIILVTFYIV